MLPYPLPLIEALHEQLVARLEQDGGQRQSLQPDRLRATITELVAGSPSAAALSPDARVQAVERLFHSIAGLGPLEPLLSDPTVTEIMVNGMQSVFVEREGQLLPAEVEFINEQEILRIINRIVGPVGRRIDESSPLVDARLPDGSRVNAIIAPLSRIGPVLTIRRFPPAAFTLSSLVERGTLSPAMAAFLSSAVGARLNILISGSTGSGKTTTLNALCGAVGPAERLLTIEDTAEMRLSHPHLVRLEARQPNIEGEGEVSIRTLLKNALRMRPDRIIIGETRGGEALDMLQAMNTGHQGSLTTIHANSPGEALSRLETMALMTDIVLPLSAVREQVKNAIHLVVQQERLPDGSRRAVAISEMLPDQRGAERYELRPLFTYHKLRCEFRNCGSLPERSELFEAMGVPLEPEWFL